jgi:cytochrome c oxidase subunit 2
MNELLLALLNLPPQASSYARSVDLLHLFVITTTMLGATLVFLMALGFTIRFRRRSSKDVTPRVTATAAGETLVIGGILTLFLAWWVIGQSQYATIMTPPADATPIYVTGQQWMWKFSYPDGTSTIDELFVPVGRPVKLVMTSRDVIHSFYVPEFRMKHDVVPGRYYTAWFNATRVGRYDIDCAEFCGTDHSRMRGVVHVLSPADHAAWVDGRRPQTAEAVTPERRLEMGDLAAEGRAVAMRRGCLSCHTVDGQSHIAPTWAGLYLSTVRFDDGRTLVADEAYLTRSMMDPNVEVVAGYKPLMPTYKGLLTEPEVAAVVELIKALREKPIPPSVKLPAVAPSGPLPGESSSAPVPQGPLP